jgi:hypothetical protein
VIPRQWKVIETVREKFTCRDCEAITQPPAPVNATPRGFIRPKLLATILFDKFAQHIPLNRQSQRFKCEGIDLGISTLADQVGAGVFAAIPLYRLIEAHVLAAERLHGDDTTVPVWRRRGPRPAGSGPMFATTARSAGKTRGRRSSYSPDREGAHPSRHLASYAGILQADAYAGYGELYEPA